MSDDLVGIRKSEAEAAVRMIQQQSEAVNQAIARVQRAPTELPSWHGRRKREFEETVQVEMRNLTASARAIEESAKRVRDALVALLNADGVRV